MTKLAAATPIPADSTAPTSLHIVMLYHSVISDWNNGNAHFLRGLVRELTLRNHHVTVYEPRNGWSIQNLESTCGPDAEAQFRVIFPEICYVRYNPDLLQLDEVLDTADVVIVHEWNDHDLVRDIGRHHRDNPSYTLLFHDTHHRTVTAPDTMAEYDLSEYDGVLAFGEIVRDIYLERGWTQQAWTLHEAADVALFHPRANTKPLRDILWIGNWGDEERTAEPHDYFFHPVRELNLTGSAYGVRYPDSALRVLEESGTTYGGWVPNYKAPILAANHRLMVHVPRRPYVEALPGIPTIRMFEAMACGVPLVISYWNDAEQLFTEGHDYLMATSPTQMQHNMSLLLHDHAAAQELATNALRTVCSRHTCAHRAEELLQIIGQATPKLSTRNTR